MGGVLPALPAVDDIDPMIGVNPDGEIVDGHRKGSCGNVSPGALVPFGMVQLAPDTKNRWDNGYHYNEAAIEGFSFMHLSGIGYHGEFGNFEVMPAVRAGEFDFVRAARARDYASEKASAGYYSVVFRDPAIRTELSAARRSGILRFTYPADARPFVRIDLSRRIGQKNRWMQVSRQTVRIVNDRTIEGEMFCPCSDGGWGRGEGGVTYTLYYRCSFSRPFRAQGVAEKSIVTGENKTDYSGSNLVFFAEFEPSGEPLLVKAGFSFVDGTGARENLKAEIPTWDFDAVVRAAREEWAAVLERFDVKGGTPRERKIFATALYRACHDPRTVVDIDGRSRGADGRIRQNRGFVPRTVFSGWDVFRQEMPMLTLLRPDVVSDTLSSMSAAMDESGRRTLPVWDIFGCPSSCMIGHPLIPVAADAWSRGIVNFPLGRLYEQAKATSRRAGNGKRGYCADGWMDVSRTLEYAYDDWCIGRLAEALGRTDEAQEFFRAGQAYRRVWNDEVHWFRQRLPDANGKPVWAPWKGLDVAWQGTIECTPHQQGWFVPHDPYGLIRLMGGDGPFVTRLSRFMDAAPKYYSYTSVGYCHANEPDHHVPMLAHYAGRPDLTQKWTRNICERAYDVGVNGLCGAEDEGQMSAWYVLSAIGLQTACPGDGLWLITSPVFLETTIRLDPNCCKGKAFTIRASAMSKENVYIRAARLNGKLLDRLWLTAAEVTDGGVLELDMASEPGRFPVRPPSRPLPDRVEPQARKPLAELYVAPNGMDDATGSIDDPFATLDGARRAIRQLDLAATGGVCVNVRGGTYPVKSTFALTVEDSGLVSAPIVYRAYRDEKPVLDGGFRVLAVRPDGEGRISVDVRSAGFSHFEPIPNFGWHAKESGPVTDLYADGRRLILARHPNEGWLAFDEANKTTGIVRADAVTVGRFAAEPDLRAMGYWRWLWADLSTGIRVTDTLRGEFALSLNPQGFGKNFPFYFENALAALDRPGEWVLDRKTGVLHAILPKGTKELVLTSFSEPFVSLEGVRHVAFKGIGFRHGRGDCMRIRNAEHVAIVGCMVQAFGNDGIVAKGSRFVSVKGSILSDFGTTALDFTGGNRRTLDPSDYLFADNDISRTGHWRHTYAPGLHLSGCGARILHNAFHDMPSSAMRLDGNDFTVASNVVERCVKESDDQGAIDIYANPSFAGIDIVHNLWRDIGGNFSSYDGGKGLCGQAGVRFDDAVSNMRVYGNRFDNCAFGIFGGVEINGGRNNLVDNNLFTRCGLGVSIIRWGKERQWWTNYVNLASVRKSIYQDVCITNAPYKSRYPGIERLPGMDYVNRVTRNIMVGGRKIAPCDEVRKTVLEGNVTNFCGRVDDGPFSPGGGFDPLPAVSDLGPRKR